MAWQYQKVVEMSSYARVAAVESSPLSMVGRTPELVWPSSNASSGCQKQRQILTKSGKLSQKDEDRHFY
jgi:hypothetical protein